MCACVCGDAHVCQVLCVYSYVSTQPPLALRMMMESVCHPATSL